MEIKMHEITIGDLTEGYADKGEDGVTGYGGRLDIRPPYQREFVYKDKQRDAVIDTVWKDFPLNVMYWAVREDGDYEIMDGQQRTLSICQYLAGAFSWQGRSFHNLQADERQKILDYKLNIYHCTGKASEKLDWFRVINIAGEKLTDQEMRNAIYAGPWVTDAKKYFSRRNCAAYNIGHKYLDGSVIKQEYLETVLKWKSDGKINEYMNAHKQDASALELWLYFQKVINWVEAIFPEYRREMKGQDWGRLYNRFHDTTLDPVILAQEVTRLMADDDVSSKKGVYPYVLTREEKHLNIRKFDNAMRRSAWEQQGGICKGCNSAFPIEEMEADHIIPWSQGGATVAANCQMLCKPCNRTKSDS